MRSVVPSFNQAFTLIELLVVITIMMLITGVGLVNFTRYKEKKSVQLAAEEIYQLAVTAKTKARTRQAPIGACDKSNPIVGYRLVGSAASGLVEVHPLCGVDELSPTSQSDSYQLPTNMSLNTDISVYFYSLNKGVDGDLPLLIQVSSQSYTFGFEIDTFGNIGEVKEIKS